MGRAFRSKTIGVRAEVCLEDRLQYQFQRTLHHAISNTWNLQRSHFSVCLRDLYFTVGLWAIRSRLKLLLDVFQKRDDPFAFHICKAFSVSTGGTAVFLRLLVRFLKGSHLGDMCE